MSRRRKPEIRVILPDPKYKNLVVTKFMNMVMEDGKKSTAEKIVYGALDQIANKKKTGEPAVVLQTAFDNVAPSVEVKSRRVGGAT
jgi:small subunit ribosomal protein S7